jgi:hypothetical protein
MGQKTLPVYMQTRGLHEAHVMANVPATAGRLQVLRRKRLLHQYLHYNVPLRFLDSLGKSSHGMKLQKQGTSDEEAQSY